MKSIQYILTFALLSLVFKIGWGVLAGEGGTYLQNICLRLQCPQASRGEDVLVADLLVELVFLLLLLLVVLLISIVSTAASVALLFLTVLLVAQLLLPS